MPPVSHTLAFVALCLIVVAAARTDILTDKVPNRLTYPAMLGGVLFWTIIGGLHGGFDGGLTSILNGMWLGWQWGMGGLLAGLLPYMILVFALGGLGGGDAKLMGVVGAVSGSWEVVVGTSVYAMFVALVMGLIVMFRMGLVQQTLQRIWGAALMSGARVRPRLDFEDSPRIAFALAIACGAVISGAEWLLGVSMPWQGWV